MNGLVYYLAAAVLWTGFAAQLPDLWHHRRDPLKRAFCAVIFLAGLCFALGAPPTVGLINGVIGAPNAAACVIYGAVNAFSAASLVLIVHWRGADSPDRVRRVCHIWLITYAVVIAAQSVLFAVGDAPVERRVDFDTYYATTPYIREMIVLYLLAHLAAALTTTVLCWRWTLQISGWTRRTLVVLALGWLCTSAYGVVKMAAVVGRWSGHEWDALSSRLAPILVTVGATLTAIGYIMPLLGPRIDSLVAFLRLGPLFRLVGSGGKRRTVLSWRSLGDVELRLTHRTTAIRDGLKDVSVHFDEGVRERAYRQALSKGAGRSEAEAIADAAMVAVAALSTRDHSPRIEAAVLDGAALDVIAGLTGRSSPLDTGQPSLIRMSRAVRAGIVEGAVRAERAQSR
ncbi:MAB_1171c family putative transporter [Streptomyces sp. NPDC002643]